jgi:hypothetical protein
MFFSEEDFMALGMQLAGPSTWRRNIEATNVKAFVTHYGAPPKVCSAMWFDIESSEEDPLGQWDKPLHLLLALRFLKAYPTDAELCAFFDINSRITITKWRNIYVNRIGKLLLTKVRHMKQYMTLLSQLLCNSLLSRWFPTGAKWMWVLSFSSQWMGLISRSMNLPHFRRNGLVKNWEAMLV